MASIFRLGIAGLSNYMISGKWKASSCAYVRQYSGLFRVYPSRGGRWMSTVVETAQKNPSFPCPWLMLPPVFEGATNAAPAMRYKFYSLSEDRVLSLTPIKEFVGHPMRIVGSSHGWLALLNISLEDLFLYNPISGRHIKLPPVSNLRSGNKHWTKLVNKVLLSCSPDEDEQNCRCILDFYFGELAFCCPGSSTEWTRLVSDEEMISNAKFHYKNLVYSSEQQLLFGLAWSNDLVSWDLRDPFFPRAINIAPIKLHDFRKMDFPKTEEEKKVWLPRYLSYCEEILHLVAAGQDLLFITQYVFDSVGWDGIYRDSNYHPPNLILEKGYPYVTFDFVVEKYDLSNGDVIKYAEDLSLGGWAVFIGFASHAVALPASQYPEVVKPGSIYFTDAIIEGVDTEFFSGHDIGIFNYENKTVSPCYYPCDVERMEKIYPPPIWFFPVHHLI